METFYSIPQLIQTAHFCLHITPATIALFIAYLLERSYAASTVNTYISALGYPHKLSDLPDPTRVFYIIQMLKGCGKTGARLDSRLPITLPILKSLLEVAPRTTGSHALLLDYFALRDNHQGDLFLTQQGTCSRVA